MLQFVMFGLEGAGKTTLLYKLKIPQWKREDIKQDMAYMKGHVAGGFGRDASRDPAYHYEEMSTKGMKYGIWEIPGNEVMVNMWPMFYRYVRMNAVLFVVDAWSSPQDIAGEKKGGWDDIDRITQSRYWMNFLLNEDELRTAAFILILNIEPRAKDLPPGASKKLLMTDDFAPGKTIPGDTVSESVIYEMLGVPDIMKMEAHKERFFCFSTNCADFDRDDPKWENCLNEIYTVYRTKGEGASRKG